MLLTLCSENTNILALSEQARGSDGAKQTMYNVSKQHIDTSVYENQTMHLYTISMVAMETR